MRNVGAKPFTPSTRCTKRAAQASTTTLVLFAAQQLKEREEAAMPPFAYQALVRADARTQEVAQGFLSAATAAAHAAQLPGLPDGTVILFPPVPLSIQRVANVERAQMLLESSSRATLQRFLAAWQPVLQATRSQTDQKGLIRYGWWMWIRWRYERLYWGSSTCRSALSVITSEAIR